MHCVVPAAALAATPLAGAVPLVMCSDLEQVRPYPNPITLTLTQPYPYP